MLTPSGTWVPVGVGKMIIASSWSPVFDTCMTPLLVTFKAYSGPLLTTKMSAFVLAGAEMDKTVSLFSSVVTNIPEWTSTESTPAFVFTDISLLPLNAFRKVKLFCSPCFTSTYVLVFAWVRLINPPLI